MATNKAALVSGAGSGETGTTSSTKQQQQEARPPRPTVEELKAARAHWEAAKADMNFLTEATLREIEEDRRSGRTKEPSCVAAQVVDADAWKWSYAKVVRNFPLPERIFPGYADKFLKYLDE